MSNPQKTYSGDFIRNPDRRARLLVIIQGLWVITLLVLTLWWGTLLKHQSDEIARLETQLGVSESQVHARLDKTTRMISGESGFFVILILVTNGILVYLFIRDHRRSKSLQVFFASITHELRTPLTSIKLQAETLRDMEDDPRHTPFVARLLEDVERLEGQVQQTLELARLEGGGQLELQSVAIKTFIKNKILSRYENASNRIQFKNNLDSSVTEAFLLVDSTALTMIFRNALDNAIKYSQELPAQIALSGRIRVDGKQNHYDLTITHENAQVSAEESTLGELFYRGKNSQGAGVGLYLIKSLMQKMNGSAQFKTSRGFEIELTFNASEVDHDA